MNDRERRRQRWHRFILAWMMGTALWIAVCLIAEAAIRPAPSFYVMAPVLVLIPALAFVLGIAILQRLGRR